MSYPLALARAVLGQAPPEGALECGGGCDNCAAAAREATEARRRPAMLDLSRHAVLAVRTLALPLAMPLPTLAMPLPGHTPTLAVPLPWPCAYPGLTRVSCAWRTPMPP